MTRERAKELAPIIQAYGEGKEIEYRNKEISTEWLTVTEPCFDGLCEYRIKSEPRTRPMTRGEVLYKVTTTPGMVVRADEGRGRPSSYHSFEDYDTDPYSYEWAIIDSYGNPVDGWHRFETEE